eukprot:5999775-Amphidinium_carterae.1
MVLRSTQRDVPRTKSPPVTVLTLDITVIIQKFLPRNQSQSAYSILARFPTSEYLRGGERSRRRFSPKGKFRGCSTKKITRRGLGDLFGVCGDAITAHNYNLFSYCPFARVPHTKGTTTTQATKPNLIVYHDGKALQDEYLAWPLLHELVHTGKLRVRPQHSGGEGPRCYRPQTSSDGLQRMPPWFQNPAGPALASCQESRKEVPRLSEDEALCRPREREPRAPPFCSRGAFPVCPFLE